MKKSLMLLLVSITLATESLYPQDILDKLIKVLQDIKEAKEVITEDSKDLKETVIQYTDSLQDYLKNDTTIVPSNIKKLLTE